MSQGPLGVGIVGCGVISGSYLRNVPRYRNLRLVAVTDLVPERARAVGDEYGVPVAPDVRSLLELDDVELVLNLTIPAAHAEVTATALAGQRHVYTEKPLATRRDAIQPALAMARASGLTIGCAPDTFLGPAHQYARLMLDEGVLGIPVGASATWLSRGHESWHPHADFYYQPGAGPLFDMGPYYLTVLVNMFGPVVSVSADATRAFARRTLLDGTTFDVGVPTHVTGLLRFGSGASATITMSFDVAADLQPRLEIYGTDATLHCADPNGFDGEVLISRGRTDRQAVTARSTGDMRGVGLADLADAVQRGRAPRAAGALGYHVLDVMESLHLAAQHRQVVDLTSTVERPRVIDEGDAEWMLQ